MKFLMPPFNKMFILLLLVATPLSVMAAADYSRKSVISFMSAGDGMVRIQLKDMTLKGTTPCADKHTFAVNTTEGKNKEIYSLLLAMYVNNNRCRYNSLVAINVMVKNIPM